VVYPECLQTGFVTKPACLNQLHLGRASIHQEPVHIVMAEFQRHAVWGQMPAELPLINRTPGFRANHRKELLADTHADGVGGYVKMPPSQCHFSQGGGHQDIGLATALNQVTH
jgi:hypothetical protein